jgi:P27 family predicted phage terminase small subunit
MQKKLLQCFKEKCFMSDVFLTSLDRPAEALTAAVVAAILHNGRQGGGIEPSSRTYSLYREALSLVRARRVQIRRRDKSRRIFGVQMNPAFLVAKHCLVTVNRFGANLGLSPAARSRIRRSARQDETVSITERLLG